MGAAANQDRNEGNVAFLIADEVVHIRDFERIAASGERYVAHRFNDGLYRVANPLLGQTKHYASNQLAIEFHEIISYLQRGYLLRMRGEVSKQVNLISAADIRIIF